MRQAITYTWAQLDEDLTGDRLQHPRQSMSGMHPQHPELPVLLQVEQACALLGISRSAGYRAATAGDLPILRLGRRIYVPTVQPLAMLGLSAEGDQ
jgi:excisionase family DNA binding protein